MKEKHNHKHTDECCNHEHHHNDCCSNEHHHHDDCCGHDDCCDCGHDHGGEVNKGEFAFKIIAGGIFFLIGYIIHDFTELGEIIPLICFGISYIIVGFEIVKKAVQGVIKGNIFNENFLMTIASIGAFAIGEYSEGCAVVILYTIGEFLQDLAIGKSRKSISDMLKMKPEVVTVIRNGENVEVNPEDVEVGEEFIVKPGQKIDIDGIIVNGTAEVDMSALTGESVPASLSVGDEVLSGSVNIDGLLTVKSTKHYSESTVAKIVEMIENSNDKKSHTEQFISRFAKVYTPIVCLIALLIMVVPPLFFNGEWKEWIYRGLSALVVSCPCAIVISIPLSIFGGIGACSRQGILIKGSNHLEMLSKCDIGVFDKTGTITSGKFKYVKCECYNCHCTDKIEHRELIGLIAACERYSTHPIAKSICLAFGPYAENLEVTDAKNYAGMGVSAVINGKKYYAGNEKLMQKVGVKFTETNVIGTAIYLCSEDEFLGDIVFADVIKEDSKQAIAEMRQTGIKKTAMLTGDKEPIAKDMAEKAGIDEYYSKLLPDQKVEKIKEFKKEGLVLYTGDGINDAPVLSEADVGVAMGGIGSDVAIEASDVVVMSDSLEKITVGRRIAKKTMHIANENIYFSLGVKILIIVFSALGIFDENAMWLAVFGDVGVCLIAVANSLRALYYKGEKKKKNK